ncbi:helix-turn-helix domain-containing protein [Oceanirhabdus sp. W0125-5]|uniref:helix-turn-helix domain-containing protein n=1 Tax=Oceanirhabdus sp. W0125-5 TaxID=2999116 RepID=UPI0022F328FA|nr:helix-turn-helix transcriptional regulator [Oceanirhabdus sp. W0125-5]WBW96836.1 helix-turn-helix transcriptional regulator [Oceanirhabdus sp. W0125-5]
MHNNSNFGISLTQLLNILNISGKKLATALNVDPSLISKWKTGKRKINANSNYLGLISNYLADNIINEYQSQEIINLFTSFNISLDDNHCCNMSEYINKILLTSLHTSSSINNINNTLKNIDRVTYSSIINTNNNQKSNDFIKNHNANNSTLDPIHIISGKYGYSSNFEIILGHKNIINTALDLLKSLKKKPSNINDSILITFFTELDSFSNYEETYYEWNNTLLEVQKKGWNITKFISLMKNKDRNIKIISEFLMNFNLQRYDLNYLNNHDSLIHFKEFIIIPTVGVLICFCNENVNKIDFAFLIRDEMVLTILQKTLSNYYNSSSPIINNKYTKIDLDLLSELTLSEESKGNRFALNPELNLFTLPLNSSNYTFLNNEKLSDKELSKMILFHERRVEAFKTQLKNFKFYAISSKQSIIDFIENNGNNINPQVSFDILIHLENMINLLENNDNYQIALLNDTSEKDLSHVSYMIKDYDAVFVQSDNQNNTSSKDNSHNNLCISITEPTIVNGFCNHFWDLWNTISPINKDKKSVVSWLKSQVKVLKNP